MRFGIHLCFDGTNFAGWQRQANAITVQEAIENALKTLSKKEISVVGCGRTDSGVHALNFFAHFDIDYNILTNSKLIYNTNAILPKQIHIFDIFSVNSAWNARFSATSRVYKYYILKEVNPFFKNRAWDLPIKLDVDKMKEAALSIVGIHDFSAFAKLHGGQKTSICNLARIEIRETNNLIIFEVCADRFLRNMVRAIVGTLVDIGKNRQQVDYMQFLLNSKDRNLAGISVPAHALYLSEILYDNDVEIPKNKEHFFVS